MMVKYLWIISIFLFLNLSQPKKIILFFGDSITAGHGLTAQQAFPALVEAQFKSQGRSISAINAGLSGETSAGGLSRIDWILRQPIDIFVLELGGNDGLRGLPLEETKKNLQGIIDKVKTKNPNVKIVIAGMMVPPNMGPDYSNDFKTIFPELAKKNKAILIPFLLEGVAGDEKLNLADGIHPNVEGHAQVAKLLVKILAPLL